MSTQPAADALIGRDHPVKPSAAAPLTDDEQRVWDLLPRGREYAIKQKHLADYLDMDVRTLQATLKRLTEQHGKPIASSCRKPMGVFVPRTEKEVNDYVGQLRARATSAFRRIAALNRAAASELLREHQQALAFPEPALCVGAVFCTQCHQQFQPYRTTQVYCSADCRLDAARARGTI